MRKRITPLFCTDCQTLGQSVDEAVLHQLQLDRMALKQPPFIAIEAEVEAGLVKDANDLPPTHGCARLMMLSRL